MRVLCCTPPMEGLLGPLLPLAEGLVGAGADVVVATGPDVLARVAAAGLRGVTAGPGAMESAMAAFADPAVAAAPADEQWRFGAALFGSVIAPAKLPALRALAKEWRPDLVLHAPLDLAAPLVAAELGLRSVTYGTGLVPVRAMLADLVARVAPLWQDAGLATDDAAGLFRHRYLDPCPPALQPDPGPAAAVAEPVRPTVPRLSGGRPAGVGRGPRPAPGGVRVPRHGSALQRALHVRPPDRRGRRRLPRRRPRRDGR